MHGKHGTALMIAAVIHLLQLPVAWGLYIIGQPFLSLISVTITQISVYYFVSLAGDRK